MDINTLAISRDKAGEKLQDLKDKRTEMAIKVANDPKSVSKDDMKDLADKIDAAQNAFNLNQSALDDARASLKEAKPEPVKAEPAKDVKPTAEQIKDKFVKNFTDMVTSGTTGGANAGLTIPQDIQTAINQLVREMDSLQNYVNVENVTTNSGSRVYEKEADITPLAELDDEGATIGDNDDPVLTTVKYLIKRYAGITTVTNSLLKDTADNIMAWLENWIARKVVVTRNKAILGVLGKASRKPTIANFDDVKDLELTALDPAINATSSFITNQSGFAVLAKCKDAEGRYMIQPSVTNPEVYQIGGHVVNVIADRFLPDVSGSHPLYYGDFRQAVTLFNRENMTIVSTNVGGNAFETDTTKVRVIDRFDVELVDDGAFAAASFKNVANQTANTSASSSSSSSK